MATLANYGVVSSQRLIEEFTWNEKDFYSYLITFNEYEGYFRLIRESIHEQALIGAQMIFDYSDEQEKITKYRVIGYQTSITNKKVIQQKKSKKLNG